MHNIQCTLFSWSHLFMSSHRIFKSWMLDPVVENQRARQRKKIEKDRRRKQYEDIQVQGTNNSSIVSKRSVEMLYTSKLEPDSSEWFKYFVKKAKRRSPAINRGYWIRMHSIKSAITKIIEQNPGKPVCIVNLGCGYDPLPFQILEEGKYDNITILDFDYPDLLVNKVNMVRESSKILSLLGQEQETDKALGVLFASENYKIVACDLKDENRYTRQLASLIEDKETVSIFIAEVSLAYMNPEHANPIIDISSKVKNSHFLILEQILPCGEYHPFAKKMLYHFSHLSSPLRCVQTYPTKEDQVNRFKQYYPKAEIQDLFENWNSFVDDGLKKQVAKIEEFDEWEEFIVFCQHYVVVHATNMNQLFFSQPTHLPQYEVETAVQLSAAPLPELQLKFPGVCKVDDEIFIFGGSEQTRTNNTLTLSANEVLHRKVDGLLPNPRMCCSFTSVGNSAVMIGGRGRPNEIYSDVFSYSNDKWEQLGCLRKERSRHSAVKVSSSHILVFGGVDEESFAFELLDILTGVLKLLRTEGTAINYSSSGMVYDEDEGTGYIIGGMADQNLPTVNDTLYKFTLTGDTIAVSKVAQDAAFQRIGCQLHLREQQLYIIGGASTAKCLGATDSILRYDLVLQRLWLVPIAEQLWKDHAPMLIGFTVVINQELITLVGGGAVCYSFGSCYNQILEVGM